MVSCQGCGTETDSRLCCPTCNQLGRKSFFCSQSCFSDSWSSHYALHNVMKKSSHNDEDDNSRRNLSAPSSLPAASCSPTSLPGENIPVVLSGERTKNSVISSSSSALPVVTHEPERRGGDDGSLAAEKFGKSSVLMEEFNDNITGIERREKAEIHRKCLRISSGLQNAGHFPLPSSSSCVNPNADAFAAPSLSGKLHFSPLKGLMASLFYNNNNINAKKDENEKMDYDKAAWAGSYRKNSKLIILFFSVAIIITICLWRFTSDKVLSVPRIFGSNGSHPSMSYRSITADKLNGGEQSGIDNAELSLVRQSAIDEIQRNIFMLKDAIHKNAIILSDLKTYQLQNKSFFSSKKEEQYIKNNVAEGKKEVIQTDRRSTEEKEGAEKAEGGGQSVPLAGEYVRNKYEKDVAIIHNKTNKELVATKATKAFLSEDNATNSRMGEQVTEKLDDDKKVKTSIKEAYSNKNRMANAELDSYINGSSNSAAVNPADEKKEFYEISTEKNNPKTISNSAVLAELSNLNRSSFSIKRHHLGVNQKLASMKSLSDNFVPFTMLKTKGGVGITAKSEYTESGVQGREEQNEEADALSFSAMKDKYVNSVALLGANSKKQKTAGGLNKTLKNRMRHSGFTRVYSARRASETTEEIR